MEGSATDSPRLIHEVLQLAFKARRTAFYANRTGIPVPTGTLAVVSVDRGEDMGQVVAKALPADVEALQIEGDFLRLPDGHDIDRWNENRQFEKTVLEHCAERVKARGLEMRLTDCEAQLDRNRIRVFFTADQRTDFRGLVRDLASAFRARIEMRQIGVRDDARYKDGVGICGRRLCCAGYLNDFKSVTLKSVRDQNLSPNPSKVSGSCSRLMCCLEYETDFYRKAARTYPRPGMKLKLNGIAALVKAADIFRETVSVVYDDGSEETVEIEDFHRRRTMTAEPETPVIEEPAPAEPHENSEKDETEEDSDKTVKKVRRRFRKKRQTKQERKS
jgi:cell fate regulator YaaT (PSP1 superfamily)